MNQIEQREIDPREFLRPHFERYLLRNRGNVLIVDDFFALMLRDYDKEHKWCQVVISSETQNPIIREKLLERRKFEIRQGTQEIGHLILTFNAKTSRSFFVGTRYGVKVDSYLSEGIVFKVESSQGLDCSFQEQPLAIDSPLTRRLPKYLK